jgi:8-oxo-dGTP pyrophosphatase MutT (NUDIX family)
LACTFSAGPATVPRRLLLKSRPIPRAPITPAPQSGVIPYRRTGTEIEILLITSSRRRRWTIPKGFVKTGIAAAASAAEEAWEEAGIRGVVSQAPIGSYVYTKRSLLLSVGVFSFQVVEVLDVWPEQWKRQRQWMSLAEAVASIEEPGLKSIIKKFRIAISATQANE